jgi:hypothetical protein
LSSIVIIAAPSLPSRSSAQRCYFEQVGILGISAMG